MISGEIKGDQLQEYNTNAFKDFNEKALSECPNCHRQGFAESLKVWQFSDCCTVVGARMARRKWRETKQQLI